MTGKYEINSLNLDEFELCYKDKDGNIVKKPFKRTVELACMIQNVDADARFKMLEYLNAHGKSKKDLIIETKDKDGKIIVDETNYREFENEFLKQAQYDFINDLYKKLFGMTAVEVIMTLNLDENEAYLFSSKIREILINGVQKDKIPS